MRFKDAKTATLSLTPAAKFAAHGARSLVDGKKGDPYNFYENWLGFEGESPEAVIDLGSVKSIRGVAIGCLSSQPSWIFTPKSIRIQASRDNILFEEVGKVQVDLAREPAGNRQEISIGLDGIAARYLKIVVENQGVCPDWHAGAAGKAWLLIDEIDVLTH